MRVALFYHSLVSDWNHGNAHFLRGIASELKSRGIDLRIFEPADSWSRCNLIREVGHEAIGKFTTAFPALQSRQYALDQLDVASMLDGVDLALVHEWNDPQLIAAVGDYRRGTPSLRVFFHDTHHRAFTAQDEIRAFQLKNYDGVLAYGSSLQDLYRRCGWKNQVHVWHEAADTRTFYPRPAAELAGDVVWIGNWGDEERSAELVDYFVNPVAHAKLNASAYGVRYPAAGVERLNEAGITYRGWCPNYDVPDLFARFRMTIHIPRRPYVRDLPGIPTIRPFEALACGIPLISAPWTDTEDLFRVGEDFLMVGNGHEMKDRMNDVRQDRGLAETLIRNGLQTIRARHTCSHRVNELMTIYSSVRPSRQEADSLLVRA